MIERYFTAMEMRRIYLQKRVDWAVLSETSLAMRYGTVRKPNDTLHELFRMSRTTKLLNNQFFDCHLLEVGLLAVEEICANISTFGVKNQDFQSSLHSTPQTHHTYFRFFIIRGWILGWKSNVVIVNNQSATRKLFSSLAERKQWKKKPNTN